MRVKVRSLRKEGRLLWSSAAEAIPAELLKPAEGFVGSPTPLKWGKTAKQNVERRLLLVMRQRGVTKDKGASATRIGIAITECTATVTALAKKYASTESIVMSDEDPSYASFKQLFADHRTINQSKEFSKPARHSGQGPALVPAAITIRSEWFRAAWGNYRPEFLLRRPECVRFQVPNCYARAFSLS